jgi:uncharacterized heparinase superfamily protein
MTRLWIYNLHYFDDLNAKESVERLRWHEELLRRWVAEIPAGTGPGWEPYPVSRRIVNWVKWALRGNALPSACISSLAIQARWLMRRLEFHLLGNHLLANAKALLHVGLYFEGPEAESWRARGLALLQRELRAQVLADGGHFELSPMYHAAVLEDLLDTINLLRSYEQPVPEGWNELSVRMRNWLRVMCHPDGDIAFFNDAALGIAPTSHDLELYAIRLGLPASIPTQDRMVVLDSTGYVRALSGAAYVICDCAAVGPDHQPGHAHADTLSFEMSIGVQRLFVNSGTSQYGEDWERQRQRATAAHNTVNVNGRDSSETWGGFRVARRAYAHLQEASVSETTISIAASHDGYRRLPSRNEHYRRWILGSGLLEIRDQISGSLDEAEARLYVHPEVDVSRIGSREFMLTWANGGAARAGFLGADVVEVRSSTWHPRFGATIANQCLVARFSSDLLRTTITWAPA